MQAVEHGADMVELRLDALRDVLGERPEQWKRDAVIAALAKLIDDLNVPVIVTCRPAVEGGLTGADDDARLTLLAAVAHDAPCYADLEWRTLHNAGGWPWSFLKLTGQRAEPTRIILSSHHYDGRPQHLISLFADMSESRADIVKLVWRARSVRDNVECFELLRDAAKPTIALCLGEEGLVSRVLAKKFGAFLTFASLDDDRATADGQVPLRDMKRLYRWDAIKRTTKVYGVVGQPVDHSLSPHVHNAAFEAAGVDAVYLPMLVQPGYESFKAFMESFLAFEPLQLSGLSVTLPHKENALRYVRERGGTTDAAAERIGSVNTIRIERDPATGEVRLAAWNTDAGALVAALTEALGTELAGLRGRRVAVIGAGGTGRTATAALAELGAEVTVYNRTRAKAEALAAEFGGNGHVVRAASMSDLPAAAAEVFVNATPVGLAGNGLAGASPFGAATPTLGAGTLVFDTVYTPAVTPLLRQAEAAGARAVGGEAMFLRQAAEQFKLWTGADAPLEAMRRAFRSAINGPTQDRAR